MQSPTAYNEFIKALNFVQLLQLNQANCIALQVL